MLKKYYSKFQIVLSYFLVIVPLFLMLLFFKYSFASLEPVSSVVVQSATLNYSQGEEGSWQYTKTAKWISKGKARINIKLESVEKPRNDYTDVILVLDTSGSMVKDKLGQLQSDVNELINDTIPKGNKIAIITFNDTATIENNFTDDVTVLQNSINNLDVIGETNYYQALLKVDEVLTSYNKESNRDCVVLFLTDGLPTVETPSEIGEYKLLKEKYDYLNINGIQYELGDKVLDGIKSITDNQFIASTRTLNEFLYKASISPASYEKLVLTDCVDTEYFNLEDISDITATFGSTSIDENQVIWNLDGLKTGLDAELTIDINLNDNLVGVGGVYPTHTKTDVFYNIGSVNTTESSTETTVLKDNYVVVYDANTPTGCVVSGIPSSKVYSVFDTVRLDETIPTCTGYQFKEWKIVTDNVEKVGTNQFIMPESNVTIKAVWKKVGLVKSMDGTVSKVQTLYKLMADNSRGLDTDIDFKTSSTTESSGIYTIDGTENDKYPIYYFRGIIDNNNVLFAGFCWKMVRTTSTGGVKLIYNGVYDETNKCNNTGTASQIGTSVFNSNFISPADVGYMYGTRYRYDASSTVMSLNILARYSTSSSSNYYYGDSVTYSDGIYTLDNASQKTWSDNYGDLVGYYTCRSTSTTCSRAYYVAGSTSGYQYTLILSNGLVDPTTQTITLSKEIVENSDGTYSLIEPVTIEKKDWFTTYNMYNNYYLCRDLTSTTCENKYLITSISNYQLSYALTFNYIYGNDVSWDGSKYTLTDTFTSINSWSIDRTTLAKKYHYTCLNTTGECTNVYYVHYFGNSNQIFYFNLSSGKDIEEAKKEMFTNTNDSKIKKMIDDWYAVNMNSYTEKLEDTIWCNDRSFYSGSLVGKDEDAGIGYIYCGSYDRANSTYNPSINCPNEKRDGFTVLTESGGNGALTYPVGLLTIGEMQLAGAAGNVYLNSGQSYWGLSPSNFSSHAASNSFMAWNGISDGTITANFGVRPSVSLVSGTKSIDGDGTADNPYVIGDE